MAQTATIALTDRADEATIRAAEHGIVAFNDAAAGPRDRQPLTLSLHRAGEAEPAGGLVGRTQFGRIFVSLLYVPGDLRGQGLGGELLRRAEDEARTRGCVGAYLDTYSFQARGFYEKRGHAMFGAVADFPPGHSRFCLSKRLCAPPPA